MGNSRAQAARRLVCAPPASGTAEQQPIRVSSRAGGHLQERRANLVFEQLNLTTRILVLAALASAALLLIMSAGGPALAEAKVHHSKRQVQQQQQPQPTTYQPSGRASTNWWNVWWQQYINEADQPTVRPIVAVSFNGRSINLARQEQEQQQQIDMTDELSFGSEADGRGVQVSPVARQPLQPPVGGQQQQQQQSAWQPSRPRNMIATNQHYGGAYDDLPMGIQMRGHMNRQRQPRPNNAVSPAEEQQQQQQQQVMPAQEEPIQQHYQMLDYSDETDPQPGDADSDQEQSNDSSSRNMMAGENRKPTSTVPEGRKEQPVGAQVSSRAPPATTQSRSSTPAVVAPTTTTGQPSMVTTTTTTTQRPTTVTSTQGTTASQTTTPQASRMSSRLPVKVVETNRLMQTTSGAVETTTRMQEERSTTTASSSTQQTPAERTTTKSSSTSGAEGTSTPTTPSQNLAKQTTTTTTTTSTTTTEVPSSTTSTTTELPSTTTSASTAASTEPTTTESETEPDEEDKQTTTVASPTMRVTVDPSAVTKEPEETTTAKEEEGDEDDEEDGEDSSTTSKPPAPRTSTTTQTPEGAGPSTQLPVIDLARLPKTTTTTTTGKPQPVAVTEASVPLTVVPNRGSSLMNANMDADMMKTVVEDDSTAAITLPMDTFMRMMNQMAAMNEPTTTASVVQVMSSTTALPPSGTPTTTTTAEDADEETTTPNTRPTSTTAATMRQQSVNEAELMVDVTTTTPKRKLQPPPTTTTTSTTAATTSTESMSTTTDEPTTTLATTGKSEAPTEKATTAAIASSTGSTTGGTQKTVMLSIAPSDETSRPEGSPVDTKIELMDLDLMPIQRMMAMNNRQQQQTSSSMAPTTLSAGANQPEMKQEAMVVNVEPGMRLRPPTTLSMTPAAGATGVTQPIYMIMMSQQMADELNNSTTTTGRFTTTTGRLTMNPLRTTTFAPLPQTTTTTTTTTTQAPVMTTTPVATTTFAATTRGESKTSTATTVAEHTPTTTPVSTTLSTTTRVTASSSNNLTLNSTVTAFNAAATNTTSAPLYASDKPQVANRGKTLNRVFGKQANGTSSFVSTRLRNNFGTKQIAASKINQANTKQSNVPQLSGGQMVQSMAIRQFGGANRMSVLENQPVPFGRPTMVAVSRQQQSRIQPPVFEYGASIVVRRPDEPLANGQMPNCTLTGKNFCVLTKEYPMNEVRQAVERSFRSVRIMYEELQTVSDQELHKDDFNATNNQAASGKFACQTQVEMMRPGWAKDEITKEWMLVVNTDVFPQRVRTESCAQPNTPCEFIAPFYDSTCQQRYSLHRMIAIDPHDPNRSPQVAVFKFPAGCVCRVHPIRKTLS